MRNRDQLHGNTLFIGRAYYRQAKNSLIIEGAKIIKALNSDHS
jgi:hypothetical protein